jgi:hypothetical protein
VDGSHWDRFPLPWSLPNAAPFCAALHLRWRCIRGSTGLLALLCHGAQWCCTLPQTFEPPESPPTLCCSLAAVGRPTLGPLLQVQRPSRLLLPSAGSNVLLRAAAECCCCCLIMAAGQPRAPRFAYSAARRVRGAKREV